MLPVTDDALDGSVSLESDEAKSAMLCLVVLGLGQVNVHDVPKPHEVFFNVCFTRVLGQLADEDARTRPGAIPEETYTNQLFRCIDVLVPSIPQPYPLHEQISTWRLAELIHNIFINEPFVQIILFSRYNNRHVTHTITLCPSVTICDAPSIGNGGVLHTLQSGV